MSASVLEACVAPHGLKECPACGKLSVVLGAFIYMFDGRVTT